MSICTSCHEEMLDQVGCTLLVFSDFKDRKVRKRIPFGSEIEGIGGEAQHCSDCLSPRGACHHPGCDIEQCPLCKGQAISCGCFVQFRPAAQALEAALTAYLTEHRADQSDILVFTDIFALGEYPVTSIFRWKQGKDALGWWLFAEEYEVSADILRVAPLSVLLAKDPYLSKMLDHLGEGKKAFREGDTDEWLIQDID